MTGASLARAPRQSAILATVAVLHAGAFLVVANDTIEFRLESPGARIVSLLPPPPEPTLQPAPGIPVPEDFDPLRVEAPVVDLPQDIRDDVLPASVLPGMDSGAGAGGSGPRAGSFEPPSVQMRGDRLAALVAGCYPSASRRLGEEGRAQLRVRVDAAGRAASWSLVEGTGFPRLDAAADCVVRRLRFEAGRRDDRAVEADVSLPIAFRLD